MEQPTFDVADELTRADQIVDQLALEARRFIARVVEFAEDVWAEAQAVRHAEADD